MMIKLSLTEKRDILVDPASVSAIADADDGSGSLMWLRGDGGEFQVPDLTPLQLAERLGIEVIE